MRLSAPTKATFYISVALAVFAVVLRVMAVMDVAILPTGGYLVLLIGYVVLLAGTLFHGV
jgi:hypothetical protein